MYNAASRVLARAQGAHAVRDEVNAADILALASGIALTGLPAARLDALMDLVRDGYRLADATEQSIH